MEKYIKRLNEYVTQLGEQLTQALKNLEDWLAENFNNGD